MTSSHDHRGLFGSSLLRQPKYYIHCSVCRLLHAAPSASESILSPVGRVLGKWGTAETHLKLIRSTRGTFHGAEVLQLHGFNEAETPFVQTVSPRSERSAFFSDLSAALKTNETFGPLRRGPRRADRKRSLQKNARNNTLVSECTRRRGAQRRLQWLAYGPQQHDD